MIFRLHNKKLLSAILICIIFVIIYKSNSLNEDTKDEYLTFFNSNSNKRLNSLNGNYENVIYFLIPIKQTS